MTKRLGTGTGLSMAERGQKAKSKQRNASSSDTPETTPITLGDPGPIERGKAKTAGYARNSTDRQEEALDGQVARLKRAGAELIFQELESGGNNDRPELMRLIRAVCSGKVNRIIVTRGDRLGRDDEFVSSLIGLCGHYDVPIETLDGGVISHATPQDFMMAKMVTMMAEFERRMLSSRVRNAFEGYRQEGRPLRQRMVFGYRPKDKFQLEPHPDQWETAKRTIELLRELGSFHAVSRDLTTWSEWAPAGHNLLNWFCNPILRGHIPYKKKWRYSKRNEEEMRGDPMLRKKVKPYQVHGWDQEWEHIVYNCHVPLITDEEWNDLAAKLRQPRNRFADGKIRTREPSHGLTGLAKCMNCGYRIRRHIDGRGVPWWRCCHRACRKRAGIKEEELLNFVIREAQAAAVQIAHMPKAEAKEEDPKVVQLRQQLDQTLLLEASNPEVFGPAVRHLRMQIDMVERSAKQGPDRELLEALSGVVTDENFLRGATADEQRAIFSGLLLEVQVGHVERVQLSVGQWMQVGEIPLQALPRSF